MDITELPPPPSLADLPTTPLASGHVNHEDLPWVDQGWGIEYKICRVCNGTGAWIIMNRFQPGTMLPKHRHSGAVTAFTLQGKWHYLEHDFVATAGSIIREPANSAHTLHVFEDHSEPTVVFFVIDGSLTHYGEQGEIWGIDDAQTMLERYLDLAKAQGLSVDTDLILS